MATETTSTEQSLTDQSVTQQDQAPVATAASTSASTDEASHPTPAADDKHAGEDFASALENFTTETEEAVGEDRVIKGTVLKLTATHVVVDIGTKSEGMLPLSEVLDHEGKPK
ncbi:MAG: S1 RNA-binding domain-containing protein, partial [Candidatus Sulfotelmatobacter sp.]